MTRISTKASLALISIALLFAAAYGVAGGREQIAAYYTLASHTRLEVFLAQPGSENEYFCEDQNDLTALEFAESFRNRNFAERNFSNQSIFWGVRRGDKWIVILNGFQQLYFDEKFTIAISEEEFETLTSMICSDFSDTSCEC